MGWTLASLGEARSRAGRIAVTLSAILPDLDGLGGALDFLFAQTGQKTFFFEEGHHVLLHNMWAGLLCAAIGWAVSGKNLRTCFLCLLAFNLHIACDLIGSAGADGELWPIAYFWPLCGMEYSVAWQWRLDSPINIALTAVLEIAMLLLAWGKGYSPIEIISPAFDKKVFALLGRLFRRVPSPASQD